LNQSIKVLAAADHLLRAYGRARLCGINRVRQFRRQEAWRGAAEALSGLEAVSAALVDPLMASEAERVTSLYQRHAIDWDMERGRSLVEKNWLDQFLALSPQNASILDICPEDQRRMFPTFRRHSGPNNALMFTSGAGHGEAIGTFNGEPIYHGSLDAEEYHSLLKQNGFVVVKKIVEDPDCGNHKVWLAQIASSVPDTINDQANHQ
jgi:hypothetical protein